MQKYDKFYRIFKEEIHVLEDSGYMLVCEYLDITMQMKRYINKSNGNRMVIIVDFHNCYYILIKNNKVIKEFQLEET